MAVVVVAIGIFGRYVAPYAPDEIFGAPFSGPSHEHWLGLDFAGRDVLSRFLWGGRTAIVVALTGTILGSVLFRLIIALALRWGLNPNDLKLVTATFVFGALVLPTLLGKLKVRRHAAAA